MNSAKYRIEVVTEEAFELGEGPHWRPNEKALYFVDILGAKAFVLDPQTKQCKTIYNDEKGLGVSAVIPIESDPNAVLVSVDTAIFKVDIQSGKRTIVDRLDRTGVRLNDAKCDPKGRLWIGTMGLEKTPGVVEPEAGSLYQLRNGEMVELLPKVSLSNGLAWSSDGKRMFFIDSFKRLIYSFDYDLNSGTFAQCRILVDMNSAEGFSKEELPDGMTIDKNDNLWVAMFFGSRLVHIDGRTGQILDSIAMPTKCITSACWGGDNLDELYVTSCRKFLSDEERSQQPDAGKVFRITAPDNPNFAGHCASVDCKY